MRSIKEALGRRLLRGAAAAGSDDDVGSEIFDGDGHRAYVGGLWEALGSLQFRFMIDQGLEPQHVLLDVGCGTLRGGVRFIPYLEPRGYLGLDVESRLIDIGLEKELGQRLRAQKQPEFVISPRFEFGRFSRLPDFAIAQSVFSHLAADDIALCLGNLRAVAKPNTKFYTSFFESPQPVKNPAASGPREKFIYTRQQMSEFGAASGWQSRYVGAWNHPRQQQMFEYSIRG
jgi:hypothetical protein